MVSLASLWLPILVAAGIVFVASSIVHMALPWHFKDFKKLPHEDDVLDALRKAGVGGGDYMFPCSENPRDMRSPAMKEKLARGPLGTLTVRPTGPPPMGRSLVQWFVYCIVIGLLAGYVTSLAHGPGADYRPVFRMASAVAFIGYSGALWQASIWMGRGWSATLRSTIDGLVYGLLTGGVFGWLWPA